MKVHVVNCHRNLGYVVAIFGDKLLRVRYDELLERADEFEIINCKVNKENGVIGMIPTERVIKCHDKKGNQFRTCGKLRTLEYVWGEEEDVLIDMESLEVEVRINVIERENDRRKISIRNTKVVLYNSSSKRVINSEPKMKIEVEDCIVSASTGEPVSANCDSIKFKNCLIVAGKREKPLDFLIGMSKVRELVFEDCRVNSKQSLIVCGVNSETIEFRNCIIDNEIDLCRTVNTDRLVLSGNKYDDEYSLYRIGVNLVSVGEVTLENNGNLIEISKKEEGGILYSSKNEEPPDITRGSGAFNVAVLRGVGARDLLYASVLAKVMVLIDTEEGYKYYKKNSNLEESKLLYRKKTRIESLLGRMEAVGVEHEGITIVTSEIE